MELVYCDNVFPIEIWCEISKYNYDAWCTLRSLNKHFHAAISGIDITGRFDYVYESKNGGYDTRMIDTFRRLVITNTYHDEVIIYKNSEMIKSYGRFHGDDTMFNISFVSRFTPSVNGRVLHEFISWRAKEQLGYYSRSIIVYNQDVCVETFRSYNHRFEHYEVGVHETIVVPSGHRAPYTIRDAFFLYDPISS
jgi:hypothetical protein